MGEAIRMADIKPTGLRAQGTELARRVSYPVRPDSDIPPLSSPVPETRPPRETVVDPAAQRLADFVDPPRHVASWLSDPRLVATLQAASAALAPEGRAEDAADRYAASVIETHLVAQRHLTKMTNAMLKT